MTEKTSNIPAGLTPLQEKIVDLAARWNDDSTTCYEGVLDAVTLLQDPARKISDIAAMSGYSGSGSFSRAFRSAIGISPRDFRDGQLKARGGGDVKVTMLAIKLLKMPYMPLKKIADQCGFPADNGCREFKEHFALAVGDTPERFRKRHFDSAGGRDIPRGVLQSLPLLSDTDESMLVIADRCGYNYYDDVYKNAHYFNTVFKRSMGIPPKKYRNLKRSGVGAQVDISFSLD